MGDEDERLPDDNRDLKAFVSNGFLQVPVGRCDDPHVHGNKSGCFYPADTYLRGPSTACSAGGSISAISSKERLIGQPKMLAPVSAP
jgi:hypothetical protein